MDYKNIYHWEVYDKLAEGHRVMMLDREQHIVYEASEMKVGELVKATTYKGKNGRYEFWIEETATEEPATEKEEV